MSSPIGGARRRVARGSANGTPEHRIGRSRNGAVTRERIGTAAVTLAPWSNATRAATWFDPNVVAMTSSARTPSRGDRIAFMSLSQKAAGFSLILAFAAPAAACEVPDDGSAPLRAAVSRVKHLAETEAWQKALPEGTIAQFVLLLDSPRKVRGSCYWPVEVRAGGELWKRFFVSGDGRRVLKN